MKDTDERVERLRRGIYQPGFLDDLDALAAELALKERMVEVLAEEIDTCPSVEIRDACPCAWDEDKDLEPCMVCWRTWAESRAQETET